MRQLDPRVSIVNGRKTGKTGNVLGESQSAGSGELLRREGYTGGGHGATSVHEKENDEGTSTSGREERRWCVGNM